MLSEGAYMGDLPGHAPTGLFGLAPPSPYTSTTAEPMAAAGGAREQARWSPYDMNGGTSLGIAGPDFVVLAADTRLSEGYSILTRNVSRVSVLTPRCAVATGGCHTDVATLHKMLNMRVAGYRAAHECDMSPPAAAQLLSTTLYSRRFMPYYAFNVLGGLDAAGAGAVYTYDAVGSFERVAYAAQGAGQKLIIPLLDNIVGGKNRQDRGYGAGAPALTLAEAQQLAVEAFITAGERDMYTGDAVEVYTITAAAGVTMRRVALKAD